MVQIYILKSIISVTTFGVTSCMGVQPPVRGQKKRAASGQNVLGATLCSIRRVGKDRNQAIFIGPSGDVEERGGSTTDASPIDSSHMVEIGRTESKRTAIKQDGSTSFVSLPKATSVGTFLTPIEQIAMLIYIPELEYPVLGNDKFLIHILLHFLIVRFKPYPLSLHKPDISIPSRSPSYRPSNNKGREVLGLSY